VADDTVDAPTEESPSAHSWRPADWLGVLVFGAAALCAVLWLLDLGRGLTFFLDEWDFIEYTGNPGYWHTVLQPHNGHPSMVPFSLYDLLLHTVGLRHYWPYQLILVLLSVGCGWLLFWLLRRKVHPLVAAAAAAVLMLLGPAWQDLLWPFQFGFLGSVASGLGALILLDRRTRRADVGACICLVVSIGCSGVGLPFLAGILVELAWRRQDWRRAWIPAIPFALFLAWYEAIGKSGSSPSVSPSFVVRSIGSDTATTVGALVGRGSTAGSVLTAVLALAIVVAVVRSPARAARLAMAVSGLLAFWILTLLARGASQGSASRYLYPAAVLVFLAVGELPNLITRRHRGRHAVVTPAWTKRLGTTVAVAIVAYVPLAVWWNAAVLNEASGGLGSVTNQVRAELSAVILAGRALPASFHPDTAFLPPVTVGGYRQAIAAFGSPAPSQVEDVDLEGGFVDAMLLRGRPLQVTPVRDPVGILTVGKGCKQYPIGPTNPSAVFTLPQRGSIVTAPLDARVQVRVKSFSPTFPEKPLFTMAANETAVLRWSRVTTPIRWEVEVSAVSTPAPAGAVVTVCPNDVKTTRR